MINIQTVCITFAVYMQLKKFMSSFEHAVITSIALYFAASVLFAIVLYYDVCCIFIINCVKCINLILRQLEFDEPLSAEFLFLNANHKILSHKFSYNSPQDNTPAIWRKNREMAVNEISTGK